MPTYTAQSFNLRVNALTGFDVYNGTELETTQAVETEKEVLLNEWLNEGVIEVINYLGQFDPYGFRAETASANCDLTDGTGVSISHNIISVVRAESSSFSDGQVHLCREIPSALQYEAKDPDSIHYATPQDPVYYLDPQGSSNDEVRIHVLPSSNFGSDSLNEIAKVTYVKYQTDITYDDTEITNFPKEYEHLVVLYAAQKTAEHLLAVEEDVELYPAIIGSIKQNYATGLQAAMRNYGVEMAPQGAPQGGR
jgi:hypothetical protein